jgi:5-methylcytosine-specific restriction protein A
VAQGYDQRRTAAERGYDGRWRKERAGFLALNPWCITLGSGCTLIAEVVDHIRPHRGDMTLFWDRTNWQPLCVHCHNVHKQREEAGRPEVQRDHRGRLIVGRRN